MPTGHYALLNAAAARTSMTGRSRLEGLAKAAWFTAVLSALLAMALVFGSVAAVASEENAAAASESRLAESVKYLASDELEGRGLLTQGIHKAAEYIAAEFRGIGLATDLFDGTPFQKFAVTTNAQLGPTEQNRLALVAAGEKDANGAGRRVELKLAKDFTPLAIGGSAAFDAPIVFVGYGITARQPAYDDYQGLDVAGKVVLMLRKEPQQNNPHSEFDGTKPTQHAEFRTKISNAFQHGAAAVIIVNDQFDLGERARKSRESYESTLEKLVALQAKYKAADKPTLEDFTKHRAEVARLTAELARLDKELSGDYDAVLSFHGGGFSGSHPSLPVFFCTRAVIDPVIRAAMNTDLATIEQSIDKDLKPRSGELAGWRAVGEAKVERQEVVVQNVIGTLPGEGPKADEILVVGAHYDHLGLGEPGSLAPGSKEVHNGADDNASGTAVLMEVARRLAAQPKKLPRTVVFMAFAGEERGLFGSAHYTKQPKYPLDKTVAMVNMDMVGRLRDDKLIAFGTGTAVEFDRLVDDLAARHNFKLTKKPSGFGPSDHASFYAKQIPVLHYFTDTHGDYHRPTDDFEKINVQGLRRIADLVVDTIVAVAESPERPTYLATKAPQVARGGGDRPYFGSIPDFSQAGGGYAIAGVAKGSPAEEAGILAGDVLTRLGTNKIGSLEDFDAALRKFKAGDKVELLVRRGDKDVTLTITLGAPR
jgi:hypothetical protein